MYLFGALLCTTLVTAVLSGGTLHTRSYFYVGQTYSSAGPSAVAHGQMYVERLAPAEVTQPYPLLFIHGGGMTGTNLLTIMDDKPGWADYFLAQGYEVYVTDQPARGRSAYQAGIDGPQSVFATSYVESHFTATEQYGLWPQASLHTQWPGNGSVGDPFFDNFYASTVPSLSSNEETAVKTKAAGSLLLDRIGPVILMTHSQSGQLGWILADARPTLVKAIVALEPLGPPFTSAVFPPITAARPYGLTEIPLLYSPSINSAEDLEREVVYTDESINVTCFRQASPARQLVNLVDIPVLMVTTESGYHALYDNCTAGYLEQAGVAVTHVHLADVGIHGNGHMMFMEANRMDIAENVVHKWLTSVFG